MFNIASPIDIALIQIVSLRFAEILLECRKLANKDLTSSSDPRVSVFLADNPNQEWHDCRLIGATEVVKDDLNPKFQAQITVEYNIDGQQEVRFRVEDVDADDWNFLGNCCVDVHQLAAGVDENESFTFNLWSLSGKMLSSELTITVRNVVVATGNILVNVSCEKLDQKDFFGKSDPYLLFHDGPNSTDSVFLRTDIIKNTLNPHFGEIEWGFASEEGGIFIECWDWNRMTKHELIGSCVVSTKELLEGACGDKELRIPLINEKKSAKSKKYKNSGYVVFTGAVDTQKSPQVLLDAIANKQCTFTVSKKDYMVQSWYHCRTCNLTEQNNTGCCVSCKDSCHLGHDVVYAQRSGFFCDCAVSGHCKLYSEEQAPPEQPTSQT